MTNEKVIEILEGELECNKHLIGKPTPCGMDCDNCELLYKRGTFGERIEAFPIAISSLSRDIRKELSEAYQKGAAETNEKWAKFSIPIGKLEKMKEEIVQLSPTATLEDVTEYGDPIKETVWEILNEVLAIIDKYIKED